MSQRTEKWKFITQNVQVNLTGLFRLMKTDEEFVGMFCTMTDKCINCYQALAERVI